MSEPAFRFLHAGDLRLGRVGARIDQPPDGLVETLIDATYRAAERLFDVVVREEVDFVVLTGDVIDPDVAGVRGVLFLQEQLRRLAECDIPVYWATAADDEWPSQVSLPDSVVRLVAGKVGVWGKKRRGRGRIWITAVDRSGIVATPSLSDRDADKTGDVDATYTMALGQRPIDSFERLADGDAGVDYWAFGGSHRRHTLFADKTTVAHVAGSHQGLDPNETDAHGATIVSVDEEGQSRLWFVPTDVLRWRTEVIDATAANDPAAGTSAVAAESLEDVEARVFERAAKLAEDVTAVDLAVTWQLRVPVILYAAARHPEWLGGLVVRLNQRFTGESPSAWAVWVEAIVPADMPSQWRDRDDLRGELLRVSASLGRDRDEPIGIETALVEDANDNGDSNEDGESADSGYVEEFLQLEDAQERQRLLGEATALGVSWLTAEEAQS